MPDLITQRLTLAKFLGDIEPKYPEWGTALREQFPDTDLEGIPFLRKGFELEDSDLEMVSGERADIATISTIALDRDREVLLPEGADLRFYQKNPIVPYAHDYRGLPIGRTEWVKIDSKTAPTALIAKTKYASAEANPMAEQVYLLHAEGILRAKSVGFIPIASKGPNDDDWVEVATAWRKRRDAMLGHKTKEADPRRIYTKWVLLEQSPVPVPSNPEALAMVVSKGIITMEEAIASGFVDEFPIDPISAEMAEKPYANEHACRLNDPGKYDKFTRKNCAIKHDNKCIDVIYGIKGGKSEMQAYRYPKDIWTAATAKKHCKDHDGTFEAAKEKVVSSNGQYPVFRHKITEFDSLWNKTLEDAFDITEFDDSELDFDYAVYTKFLDCAVKNICIHKYEIPSPLIGTYLSSIESITSSLDLKDTRRFSSSGKESPPRRSQIQLNSKRSGRFLTDGTEFCHTKEGIPIIKDFYPSWGSLYFSIIADVGHEEVASKLMMEIHQHAASNHMLKGEKFSLSGEFLEPTDDAWDELIISSNDKQAIQKSLDITTEKSKSRGLLFIGPPGTGKTKAGRTLMNSTENTFIWMSTRDFNYGYPSSILMLAFDMARKLAPTVLFMEDIDSGLNVDLIKTELDGLRQNAGMMTILTTNFPERLPKALIDRPGRFHHVLYFKLPNANQRKQMFELWGCELKGSALDEIVKATESFSGAHIKYLIEYAATIAEDEEMGAAEALAESLSRMSEQRDMIEGIQSEGSKDFSGESNMTVEEILEAREGTESPEISDEEAQKILDMLSTRLTPEVEDIELTVEELLEFHNTGLV